jgi:hypothetical protein
MSVWVLMTALLLGASPASEVDAGVKAYQAGKFAAARDALAPLADRATVPAAQRARARTYLAAALYGLGDLGAAARELRRLAKEHPTVRLDEGEFFPELVQMAQTAREEMLGTAKAKDPKPKDKKEPKVVKTEPEPKVAKTEPEPKAVAKTDPEPKVVAKTEPEPKVVAKTEPEPKVVAKTEPEPKVVAKTEPEPKVVAKTEPEPKVVKTEPEPAADAHATQEDEPRAVRVRLGAFGFGDPLGRSVGAGATAGVAITGLDLSARGLFGTHVGFGAEVAYRFNSDGVFQPRIGLRFTGVPGASAWGGGAAAGVQLAPTPWLWVGAEVGVEYFAADAGYRSFAVPVALGVGASL